MGSRIVIGMLVFCMSVVASAADYRSLLRGKYLLMEGASCAGIKIAKNGIDAVMYVELGCFNGESDGFNMRMRWITPKSFVLIGTDRSDEVSPPQIHVFVVEGVQGKKVRLREISTGWNDSPDFVEAYTIK